MKGMLSARPNAINQKLPLDAPAMANTLSLDMGMSATTMYQMACQKRIGLGAASGGVLASISTLSAIHRMSSPPAICRYEVVSRRAAMVVSATRNTTAAPYEMVTFTQTYNAGDQLSTDAKLTDLKLSYEYLTWPYPVESRHFRLKTLYQVQYISMKGSFDAPIRSATPDSAGNFTSYTTQGSKSFVTPAFGLGVHEYATRNFRFEANVSGFMLPHRWHLVDSDATIAYRAGRLELRAGAKAFLFRTSPKTDYFYRGTVGGAFVGLRWYSD